MKPAPFAYARPTSIEETLELLGQYGDDAKVLAGGQSLVPMMNLRLARPEVLVDINDVDELASRSFGETVVLGALTRQAYLAGDREVGDLAPLLAHSATHIGHAATRARGTVGGSLAHADPAAELSATLLALDAVAVIAGSEGERKVPIDEFVVSYFTTVLAPSELLVRVEIPASTLARSWAFEELARRRSDFALAGAIVTADLEDGHWASPRVVIFGVLDAPIRLTSIEAMLVGQPVDHLGEDLGSHAESMLHEALADRSGSRSADEYRSEVAGALLRRALCNLQAGSRVREGVA